ncbi:hypothetical protein SynRS9902_02802 [Synechococcus sp. RS9902]|nr:hypothetical protein SynRS9902_02802 [Synechococcus sp. RS9902]
MSGFHLSFWLMDDQTSGILNPSLFPWLGKKQLSIFSAMY